MKQVNEIRHRRAHQQVNTIQASDTASPFCASILFAPVRGSTFQLANGKTNLLGVLTNRHVVSLRLAFSLTLCKCMFILMNRTDADVTIYCLIDYLEEEREGATIERWYSFLIGFDCYWNVRHKSSIVE